MSVRALFFLLLTLSLVPQGPASAQTGAVSVQVAAGVEPTAATVGEMVVLTVRVRGVPGTVVQTPKRPAVTNLEPQQDAPQRRRLGTGEARGVAFSWRFRSQRAGTARIRPVTVVVQGERYTTEEMQVRVRDLLDATTQPTLTYPEGASATPLDAQDLFVQASATTERLYQNEQAIVEYRLFYRPGIRLRHSRLADSWDAPGFWREELNVASRPRPQTRRVEGRRYETVVLKRVALFPTRPGTLRVDPLRIETEAQGTVRMRRGGPALRGRFEPVRLASRSLSMRVRALPAPSPPAFNGAVGQFSMEVRAKADSVSVGDPVPVTVRIRGTGNLPTISPPQLDPPDAVAVYEPTVETNVRRNGRRIRGEKTFAYTLVPRAGGRHDGTPIRFSYFDPEAGRYKTLRAEGPSLQVTGTAAPRAVGRTGAGLPVGDVTDLMTSAEARWGVPNPLPLYQRPWVYLALLVPVLLAGGGIVYRRWGAQVVASTQESSEGARAARSPELQAAQRRLTEATGSTAPATVETALRTFVGARLGENGAASSRSDLDRRLRRHDVPDALRRRLFELLDRCDEAQYAPGRAGRGNDGLVEEARRLLPQLDDALPGDP